MFFLAFNRGFQLQAQSNGAKLFINSSDLLLDPLAHLIEGVEGGVRFKFLEHRFLAALGREVLQLFLDALDLKHGGSPAEVLVDFINLLI